MSTISQPRQCVKPKRFIRLPLAPFQGNPGIVTITVQKSAQRSEVTEYLLYAEPSDFGRAYRLENAKPNQEVYHVLLDGEQSSCECKGFLTWSHCKHVEGLAALRNAGQL